MQCTMALYLVMSWNMLRLRLFVFNSIYILEAGSIKILHSIMSTLIIYLEHCRYGNCVFQEELRSDTVTEFSMVETVKTYTITS